MSGRTWVTADLHLGHANIIKFTGADGKRIRPFESVEEHDNTIVDNWNRLVDPEDRVYVLGDVCINRRALPSLSRLMGRKVLVKGNHDIFKMEDYAPYFDDIRAYVVGGGKDSPRYVLSHIPIHPASLERFDYNIHGHLHQNRVKYEDGDYDPNYICVSLEHTDFKPIELYKAFKLF